MRNISQKHLHVAVIRPRDKADIGIPFDGAACTIWRCAVLNVTLRNWSCNVSCDYTLHYRKARPYLSNRFPFSHFAQTIIALDDHFFGLES